MEGFSIKGTFKNNTVFSVVLSLCALSFFFFPQGTPFTIVLLLIVSLIETKFRIGLNEIKHSIKLPFVVLSIAFFSIHLLSLLYSENIQMGLKGLELKASFLIIPIVSFIIFQKRKIKIIVFLRLLNYSAVLYGLFSLVTALINYNTTHLTATLISAEYSKLIHPSYYAVYLAIIINVNSVYLIKAWPSITTNKKLKEVALILLLVLFLFLSMAKVGLLLLSMSIIWMAVYLGWRTKAYLKIGIFSAIIFSSGALIVWNSPFKLRLTQMVEEFLAPPTDGEVIVMSTGSRIWAMKCTKELIVNNPILGVGIGDCKDELLRLYKEKNIKKLIKLKLDTHQQYAQTWATAGIFSLLILVSLFINLIWRSIKTKNILLLLFTMCFIVFGFTESMFERQAGVLFFTFVGGLFYLINDSETSKN